MRADHDTVTRLLKTARGQLDGLLKMVADDRYCIDISNQLMATTAILTKVNRIVLKAHMEGCVRSALTGDPANADAKIEELVTVFDKLSK